MSGWGKAASSIYATAACCRSAEESGQATIGVLVEVVDAVNGRAHGHTLPRQGILIGSPLERLLKRDLACAATVRHGEGLIQHLKRRAPRYARASRPPLGIAAAALGEPACVGCRRPARLFAHEAGTTRRGSKPVRADQRSIATST
jgi:hypothetical protein